MSCLKSKLIEASSRTGPRPRDIRPGASCLVVGLLQRTEAIAIVEGRVESGDNFSCFPNDLAELLSESFLNCKSRLTSQLLASLQGECSM